MLLTRFCDGGKAISALAQQQLSIFDNGDDEGIIIFTHVELLREVISNTRDVKVKFPAQREGCRIDGNEKCL